ncbi:hypothetical protein ACLOJK_032048 [Asimina triloba]
MASCQVSVALVPCLSNLAFSAVSTDLLAAAFVGPSFSSSAQEPPAGSSVVSRSDPNRNSGAHHRRFESAVTSAFCTTSATVLCSCLERRLGFGAADAAIVCFSLRTARFEGEGYGGVRDAIDAILGRLQREKLLWRLFGRMNESYCVLWRVTDLLLRH